MKKLVIYITILSFISCGIEPEKIAYGVDACHYCKMNIIDKTHAAQAVTNKGKQYKYDAAECLLNDLQQKDQAKMSFLLVTDFNTPEKMIDATNATFLISDSVKSPMGANLASFEEKNNAESFINMNRNGTMYSWHEIQQHFNTQQ